MVPAQQQNKSTKDRRMKGNPNEQPSENKSRLPEIIITIARDGMVRCLWTETVPLHELGRLAIQRACSVEFDHRAQAWRVFDKEGDCLYCSPSRDTCLAWERQYLNWVLETTELGLTN